MADAAMLHLGRRLVAPPSVPLPRLGLRRLGQPTRGHWSHKRFCLVLAIRSRDAWHAPCCPKGVGLPVRPGWVLAFTAAVAGQAAAAAATVAAAAAAAAAAETLPNVPTKSGDVDLVAAAAWVAVAAAALGATLAMVRAFKKAEATINRRQEGERRKEQSIAAEEAARKQRIKDMFGRL